MFYISVALERFLFILLNNFVRSSPRLVLFHGSAQLIAILVPTLKISTSKLSVVQGDSISSICLSEIVFWGEKPTQDLRANQFLEAWEFSKYSLCPQARRTLGETPLHFPERYGKLVGVKNRPKGDEQAFMLTYEIDEVMTSLVTLQISADDIILIYNRLQ